MRILDCSSLDSARRTVAGAFGLSESDLMSVLNTPFPECVGTASSFNEEQAEVELARRIEKRVPVDGPFDRTVFFHLTRVPAHYDFSQGLLPTYMASQCIWPIVSEVGRRHIDEAKWNRFREEMQRCSCHWANLYRLKLSVQNSGPWAFLIRHSAFSPEGRLWSHFTDRPEALTDICRCFQHRFGVPIEEEVASTTRPAIVHFWVDGFDTTALGRVLWYIRDQNSNEPECTSYDWCLDREGKPIPSSQVIRVERF